MGLDEIARRERMAVVGVAKNCGKTTTLNVLMRRRRQLGLAPPALVSIGIDGETRDVLLGTDKPPVTVVEGQWVATAEGGLRRSTARFEYMQATGFETPLGEVFIGRAVAEGTVLLAGLRHRRELKSVVDVMAGQGPGAVWIDGAYGRVAGAHPDLSDAVVVSTGAVVARTVEAIADRTEDLVSRLTIAAVDDDYRRQAIERAVHRGELFVVVGGDRVEPLGSSSALLSLVEARRDWSAVTALAICGLVSDRVLEALLTLGSGRHLLVPDATVIHGSPPLWRRFRHHWQVRALRATQVVGIGYNPTCVTGRTVDALRLARGLQQKCPATVVFNPLH